VSVRNEHRVGCHRRVQGHALGLVDDDPHRLGCVGRDGRESRRTASGEHDGVGRPIGDDTLQGLALTRHLEDAIDEAGARQGRAGKRDHVAGQRRPGREERRNLKAES